MHDPELRPRLPNERWKVQENEIASSFAYTATKDWFHKTHEYKWKTFDVLGRIEKIVGVWLG